jgi:hypothetical protein
LPKHLDANPQLFTDPVGNQATADSWASSTAGAPDTISPSSMTVQKMLLAALAAVAIRLGLVFEEYGQQPERTGRKRSKEIASNSKAA